MTIVDSFLFSLEKRRLKMIRTECKIRIDTSATTETMYETKAIRRTNLKPECIPSGNNILDKNHLGPAKNKRCRGCQIKCVGSTWHFLLKVTPFVLCET